MSGSVPSHRPRRRRPSAAAPGFLPAERAHELWSAAATTVALAGLSFWSLSTQLAAGIEVNQAAVTIGVVLLCVGRARGLGAATATMLPGRAGGAWGAGR
ncbi:hypothetical protein ACTD5D_40175 [Nocardia takedensis]|uniref:hypothetical protein n=1 Tax=Nocardia takedensis TaxID=259390 RepID=UPI003F768398